MSLEDKLEEGLAPSWRPNQSDAPEGSITDNPLFGKMVRMEQGQTANWGPQWILILEQTDSEGNSKGNEVGVWLFHTVLKNELKRLRPKPGDLLAIRQDGKKPTKDGRQQMMVYTVRSSSERPQEFSWDSLNPDDDVSGKVINTGHENDAANLQASLPAEAPAPEPVTAAAPDDEIPF